MKKFFESLYVFVIFCCCCVVLLGLVVGITHYYFNVYPTNGLPKADAQSYTTERYELIKRFRIEEKLVENQHNERLRQFYDKYNKRKVR